MGCAGGCPGSPNGWWPAVARVALGASADLVRPGRRAGRRATPGSPRSPRRPCPRPRAAGPPSAPSSASPPDQPLILSVGRLHPQKRYDVLVDAAARWRTRTPPPVVVIAGSGPAYLPLAARISAARAPVTLLGHRTDVADLLAGADLAVVTSDWEARQLFAQEALRAGVPLVATAVGGLPELVGDAALLVPAGDVDAVDAAVRVAAGRPDLRAELAARGVARAAALADRGGHRRRAAGPLRRAGRRPGRPGRPHRGGRPGTDTPRRDAGLMLRRFTPVLLTLIVVALGVTALAARPDTGAPAAYRRLRGPRRGGRAALGRRRPADAPRRCGGWPSRARSARCRCAPRTARPARWTAG